MAEAAIVFDLDGTLFDTVPEMFDSVHLAAKELDVKIDSSIDQARGYLGDGITRFVKRMITGDQWAEPDEDLLRQALDKTMDAYDKLLLRRDSLYPNVAGTLAGLQEQGWKLGVATNKIERFTRPLLERFLPEVDFGCIICGDSLAKTKPDPAPLVHAARQLGVPPDRAVMVGDSIADVSATKAAGFALMVVVSYGYHQRTGLEALEADVVIDSMDELPGACAALT